MRKTAWSSKKLLRIHSPGCDVEVIIKIYSQPLHSSGTNIVLRMRITELLILLAGLDRMCGQLHGPAGASEDQDYEPGADVG